MKNIFHIKIKVEEPHKRRKIIQCFDCQEYSHSKLYSSNPSKHVSCTDAQPTLLCTQSKQQLPTYALCGDNHLASYRGCTIHKEHQRLHNTSTNSKKNVIINKYNIVNKEREPSAKTYSDH